eukprot:9728831-Alexandrium_andersonii.AAC.1
METRILVLAWDPVAQAWGVAALFQPRQGKALANAQGGPPIYIVLSRGHYRLALPEEAVLEALLAGAK